MPKICFSHDIAKLSLPTAQRLSSSIFHCLFVVVRPAWWHLLLSPLYDVLDHTNHTFSERWWYKDLKNNVPGCLTCKYTNTNTQIHKNANTALIKVTDRHDMCYIFEKVMVRGPRKQCSRVSDLQIHKYKYTNTNTQIHKYANRALVKVADRHDMCYIFERVMVRGPQKQCSRVSDLQIHKYKY